MTSRRWRARRCVTGSSSGPRPSSRVSPPTPSSTRSSTASRSRADGPDRPGCPAGAGRRRRGRAARGRWGHPVAGPGRGQRGAPAGAGHRRRQRLDSPQPRAGPQRGPQGPPRPGRECAAGGHEHRATAVAGLPARCVGTHCPRHDRRGDRPGGAGPACRGHGAHRRRGPAEPAGDRPTDRVTLRSLGPLGLAGRQRSVEVDWSVRTLPPFSSRRHLPSRLARLRDMDGRQAIAVRPRAPSSTPCASTSPATTCARSTGGPPHVQPTSWCARGAPSATAGSSWSWTPGAPVRSASATRPAWTS